MSARDEDEDAAQYGSAEEDPRDETPRSCQQKFPDVGLLDAGEAHECVLAQAQDREDGIRLILVGEEEVNAESEWKNDLDIKLDMYSTRQDA